MSAVPNSADLEQEAETLLGMEDLESLDMGGVEDAPGFVIPPEGSYKVELSKACIEKYKTKKSPNVQSRRLAHYYKVVSVQELVDPTEKPPTTGSAFSERWQLTEDGLKYWKARAVSILGQERVNGMKLGQTIAALNEGGFVLDIKVKHRPSVGEDGKDYTNLSIQVTGLGQELPEDTGL